MIRFLGAAALTLAAASALAADPRISVNVGVPGLYGNIDIGDAPRPRVLYAQPVYAERGPRVEGPPVYLHVPPGHEKRWREHCREYDACGRPVYFVRHDWYRDVYARRGEPGRGDGRDRRDDRGRERDHRDDRGGERDRREGRGDGRRD